MNKVVILVAMLLCFMGQTVHAQDADHVWLTPGGSAVGVGGMGMCLNSAGLAVPIGPQCVGSVPVQSTYAAQTFLTASATGTTAATTATLTGAAGKTTYLCGFSIRANATAAATGNATVTGTITGTLNFTQWTAPLATGLGVTEPPIGAYCIPASAVNTAIAVVSAAPGTGGTVSVSVWGFQQ